MSGPSSKERMRRLRERRRAGRRVIMIEVDEVDFGAALEALGFLDPMLADSEQAFDRAVSELIQSISRQWNEYE